MDDVLRLDVPVDDALLVGGFQSAGHLHGDLNGLALRHAAGLFDIFLQRDAFHQLHHDVVHAVLVADVVHADDIRMGKAARRLGFPAEFRHKAGVRAVFFLQHLDRDGTL